MAKINFMQINKRQLKKWITALDSGQYTQARGLLNTYDNRYCCLGLACKVLIPENRLQTDMGRILGGFPNYQPHAPKWLQDVNDNFLMKTGRSLSALNDKYDFTFAEIATMLELVYIHKVLD